jgi:hypothetical protein
VLGRLIEKLRRLSCESAGNVSANTNRRPISGLPTQRRMDMKASTTLASLAAAASLVGVIGIAYAQSDSGTTGGTMQTPQQAQMAPADSSTTAPAADSSLNNTPAPSTNDTLANTPAPQADRN